MYVPPAVLASFDADDLLGPAYGGNPMCGPKPPGNVSVL
jgi:hypothetical protein